MNGKYCLFFGIILASIFTCCAWAVSYDYDANGRLVSASFSENQTVQYSYDPGGNIYAVDGFETVTSTETTTETTTSNIETLVWNYTTGENTNNAYTVNANSWSNAVTINYNNISLTRAVKMETASNIFFSAPKAGTLKIVSYSTNSNPTVNINNTVYSVSSNGETVIPISSSGTYTITKGTTNTYLYYLCFEYSSANPVYIWNYTGGINTDSFYTVLNANEWSSAVPISYEGNSLTRAIKMETNTQVTFTAPYSGKLKVVTYANRSDNATVKVNNVEYVVSKTGNATEINIPSAGSYTLSKGTTNTYLYLMSFE